MATNNSINLQKPIPRFAVVNNADQTITRMGGYLSFANKIFDTTSSFSGTTYTVPTSGVYLLGAILNIDYTTLGAGDLSVSISVNSSYSYVLISQKLDATDVSGYCIVCGSTVVKLQAADTVQCYIGIDEGGRVLNIVGATSSGIRAPYFWGHLIAEI